MPLDEPSVAIGNLQADMRTLIKIHTVIDDKLDKVINHVAIINEKANKAHIRLDELVDPQTGVLIKIANDATEAKETIKKGKWVLTGVAAAFATGGTVFGTWLTKIGAIFAATTGNGP